MKTPTFVYGGVWRVRVWENPLSPWEIWIFWRRGWGIYPLNFYFFRGFAQNFETRGFCRHCAAATATAGQRPTTGRIDGDRPPPPLPGSGKNPHLIQNFPWNPWRNCQNLGGKCKCRKSNQVLEWENQKWLLVLTLPALLRRFFNLYF